MPRKKVKIHEDIVENWHLGDYPENSRQGKLIRLLAEEDAFNDIYVSSVVTDDFDMLCFAIG